MALPCAVCCASLRAFWGNVMEMASTAVVVLLLGSRPRSYFELSTVSCSCHSCGWLLTARLRRPCSALPYDHGSWFTFTITACRCLTRTLTCVVWLACWPTCLYLRLHWTSNLYSVGIGSGKHALFAELDGLLPSSDPLRFSCRLPCLHLQPLPLPLPFWLL